MRRLIPRWNSARHPEASFRHNMISAIFGLRVTREIAEEG